jgi:hypothetical protein
MKKLMLGAALAASMFIAAPAAYAAQVFTLTPQANGNYAAAFGNDEIAFGDFTHTYNFNLNLDGVGSGSITSQLTLGFPDTDLIFDKITLNGVDFTPALTGDLDVWKLALTNITSGGQTLVVKGWSGGSSSYGGQMTFVPTSAVPEPAAWAMMIVGFGAAGAMVRNRRKLVPTVA